MSRLLEAIDKLDAKLACEGFVRLSPWWRETLGRFLRVGCRQLVVRVGRRGGKSSTLCKVAVAVALYGEHEIPAGDLGVVAIVSTTRDEAYQRLRTIGAMLDALGVGHRMRGDALELTDRPIQFKVFAASTRSVVGFTAIFVLCDEVARWLDVETSSNPAKEVLASLRPAMATQPSARIVLSSSPWSTDDAHHAAFEAGDGPFQMVAHAATWTANPTLTEAETHGLEADLRSWRREYAAEPGASDDQAFERADVLACVDAGVSARGRDPRAQHAAGLDLSGGRRDAHALVIAHREQRWIDGSVPRLLYVVDAVHAWNTTRLLGLRKVEVDEVLAEVARITKSYGVKSAHRDAYGADLASNALTLRGVSSVEASMTSAVQAQRFGRLGALLAQRSIRLVEHPQLVGELCALRMRLRPGGRVVFEAARGRHDDLVDALALAVEAAAKARPGGDVRYEAGALLWCDGKPVDQAPGRWLRDLANGTCVPCEPPVGSEDWDEHVERARIEGISTPQLDAYFARERGEVLPPPAPPAAPVDRRNRFTCENCGAEVFSAVAPEKLVMRWCNRCRGA